MKCTLLISIFSLITFLIYHQIFSWLLPLHTYFCWKSLIYDAFSLSTLRCILANDTEKLYVPSNLEADSYETSEFYVRHMHNQECPDQLLQLHSEDKIYFSGTHLCKENDWSIEKYQSGFCVDNFVRWEIFGFCLLSFCQNKKT